MLLVVSFAAFVGAAAVAARGFPASDGIRWQLLLLAGLAGMPANIVLNALEFMIIGRFVERRVSFGQAVKVTIVGSAANLLPMPGSTLVRVQALAAQEARYRDAFAASAVVGVTSVGVHLAVAGAVLAGTAAPAFVAGLLGGGGLAIAAAMAVVHAMFETPRRIRLGLYAVALEVLYAIVSALRLWLILLGLGLAVALPAVVALTATGALATAVGFFPAGLGIRETLIGGVSPLVGITVAAGLAGAVVERLFWFAVLAVASVAMALTSRHTAHQETPSLAHSLRKRRRR